MPTHKNQIAMIGGGLKESENYIEGAVREYEEETSLCALNLNFLGYLPTVFAAKNRLIYPCVYEVDDLTGIQSNGEWDEAFLVPIKDLLIEDSWEHAYRYGQQTNNSILYRQIKLDKIEMIKGSAQSSAQGYVLWGATARIVWNFLSVFALSFK